MTNKEIKTTMTDVIDNSECYLKPALRLQSIIKQIKDICGDEDKYTLENENENSKV